MQRSHRLIIFGLCSFYRFSKIGVNDTTGKYHYTPCRQTMPYCFNRRSQWRTESGDDVSIPPERYRQPSSAARHASFSREPGRACRTLAESAPNNLRTIEIASCSTISIHTATVVVVLARWLRYYLLVTENLRPYYARLGVFLGCALPESYFFRSIAAIAQFKYHNGNGSCLRSGIS